jgi:hypothetical protein
LGKTDSKTLHAPESCASFFSSVLTLNAFASTSTPAPAAATNAAVAAAPSAETAHTVPTLTSADATTAAAVTRCIAATRSSARSASKARTRGFRSPRSRAITVLEMSSIVLGLVNKFLTALFCLASDLLNSCLSFAEPGIPPLSASRSRLRA